MLKNDYRRALIMLRAVAPGLSGHVRLERRTLMGSMQFSISGAPSGVPLEAVLLGRQKSGRWVCIRIGVCNRDSRGQAGMTWNFDPRNIEGMELEQYDVVGVVRSESGAPEMVMFGYVNGSREIDWSQARASMDALYRPRSSHHTPSQAAIEPERDVAAELQSEEPFAAVDAPLTEEVEVFAPVAQAAEPEQSTEIVEEEIQAETTQFLTVDTAREWPELVEPLRALFMSEAVEPPFEAEGYTFIQAPMPTGSGLNHCAVGIRMREGVPDTVCYAIPAQYSIEPPPGLEGYAWRGDEHRGYWVVWQDVATGEAVEP